MPETFVVDEDPASDSLLRRVGPAWFDGDEEDLRQVMAQTYGMISHIDDNVGRAIDFLQAKGLYDHTVVAFIADHGEYLGSHHLWHKTPYGSGRSCCACRIFGACPGDERVFAMMW